MSYILDALRRAEAERERGNVPSLHSQPVAAAAAPVPNARMPAALLGGAALLVLLLVLGAAGWLMPTPTAAPQPPAVALAQAPAVVPPVPPAPSIRPAVPAPAPTPARTVSIAPAEAVKVVPVVPAPPPRPASVASAAAAPVQPPAIVPWERLPESQRRALPALAISGAIWSESAANRMLIVSGQLLHEGDTAGPGVTLEQIRTKSAVLRWNDLRYEVSF